MDSLPPSLLNRNPVTHQRHRQDVLRQITIPLIIGGLLIVAMMVLTVWGASTNGEHGRWAGISLIWLIVPTMFMAFILLALLAGLVFLVSMLLVKIPPFARKIQDFFVMVKYQTAQLEDKIIEPFLRVQQFKASTQAFGRKLRRKA